MFALRLQAQFTRFTIPMVYFAAVAWMRLCRGYRIENIKGIRHEAQRYFESAPGPILICPNHLTLIDSLILIWALGSVWYYMKNPRYFPWNVPEHQNFSRNLFLRVACYLGRCVPIKRRGSIESKRVVMAKLKQLLRFGNSIMIFPEGTRSRTGRVVVEDVAYGVGELAHSSACPTILCVYLRGKNQKTYGNLPKRGERFRVTLHSIPSPSFSASLRAFRDTARKIGNTLEKLEQTHFQICLEMTS